MAKISDPVRAFHKTIKNLYDTEKQLEMALPKMAKAATGEELAAGFEDHLQETKGHIRRLEKIFKIIGAKQEKHAGNTIRGLIADSRMVISADAPVLLKDAMLAAAGRDVEHYEMACYMNAIQEAQGLELQSAVDLLEETLQEEKRADLKLADALRQNLQAA